MNWFPIQALWFRSGDGPNKYRVILYISAWLANFDVPSGGNPYRYSRDIPSWLSRHIPRICRRLSRFKAYGSGLTSLSSFWYRTTGIPQK